MPMKKSARLYNCACCYVQVIICRNCDRGNIYCGAACSGRSRVKNLRIANQIYQKSFRGRQKHAERQRQYRSRKKNKVTDQGSPLLPPNDLLPREPNEYTTQASELVHCNFCGKVVSPFLRNGYLRHSQQDQSRRFSSLALGP